MALSDIFELLVSLTVTVDETETVRVGDRLYVGERVLDVDIEFVTDAVRQ